MEIGEVRRRGKEKGGKKRKEKEGKTHRVCRIHVTQCRFAYNENIE